MPRVATKLNDRIEVAEGTMAFAFERPPAWDFIAGQFVVVVLPNPPYDDAEGNRRVFSIASPPHDRTQLQIVTRMTGTAMKRSLAEVPLGTLVELAGPSGEFVLPSEAAHPVVFIAGGIGITPFRSMVQDVIHRRLPHQITLIYSNRTPEGTAFHPEFSSLALAHPQIRYVPTMTQAEKSSRPWNGERRRLTPEFLSTHVADIPAALFFLAGPPGLVAAATKAVLAAGVDPTRVRAEEFAGY